jgi:hypothetical protein
LSIFQRLSFRHPEQRVPPILFGKVADVTADPLGLAIRHALLGCRATGKQPSSDYQNAKSFHRHSSDGCKSENGEGDSRLLGMQIMGSVGLWGKPPRVRISAPIACVAQPHATLMRAVGHQASINDDDAWSPGSG